MKTADPSLAGKASNTPVGRQFPSTSSIPVPDPDAPVHYQEVTSRLAALEEENAMLRAQVRRSSQILDSATDYAIVTTDIEGIVTGWNQGARRIIGYTEDEILGRSGEVIFTSEDRATGRFAGELRRAIETGSATNERWHLRRDGTRFWGSGTMMPLLDDEGQPTGFLNILRDRTEAQTEAERRELFMAEMNHRIKNTFSTVQAVASQTRRHASTPAEFQAAFSARLMVLARSHDVLIRNHWDKACLHEVIEGALEPYRMETGRLTTAGPPVTLAPSLVVTVSMAFHELATNAAKYGAFSVPEGKVNVTWTINSVRNGVHRLEIEWHELDGPPVQQPKRRGFGSQLLEKGMPAGGTVRREFQPEGLKCHICLPLIAAP